MSNRCASGGAEVESGDAEAPGPGLASGVAIVPLLPRSGRRGIPRSRVALVLPEKSVTLESTIICRTCCGVLGSSCTCASAAIEATMAKAAMTAGASTAGIHFLSTAGFMICDPVEAAWYLHGTPQPRAWRWPTACLDIQTRCVLARKRAGRAV